MERNDTKKEIQKISLWQIIRNFVSNTLDQIEDGVGTVRFIVIIVVLLIAPLLWMLISGTNDSEKKSFGGTTDELQAKIEARYNNPSGMDTVIDIDDVSWQVQSARDFGTTIQAIDEQHSDCKAPEGKKLIQVVVSVTNKRSESFNLINPTIYTSLYKGHSTYINAPLCLPEQFDNGSLLFANQNIAPEQTLSLVILYLVPESDTDFRLGIFNHEYNGVNLPKEARYVRLDLAK